MASPAEPPPPPPPPSQPAVSAQVAFEQRIAEQKAQHGCLRRLDEFMFCMSVTNQIATYYHHGSYDDCRAHFQRWQTCLRSRLKKPAEGAALLQAERQKTQTGTHLFMFKPEYATEAHERYGIEPPAPRQQHESTLDA